MYYSVPQQTAIIRKTKINGSKAGGASVSRPLQSRPNEILRPGARGSLILRMLHQSSNFQLSLKKRRKKKEEREEENKDSQYLPN